MGETKTDEKIDEKEMIEQVLSCPFCGCEELELCRTNPNACWVRCGGCGADAESHKDRKQAISNWNRRQDPSPASFEEDDEK